MNERETESLNAAPVRVGPTRGGDDELLADPPPGAPPGGLDGYRAGLPMRIGLVVAIIAGVSATAWQVVQWQREKKAAAEAPLEPEYAVSEDDDDAGAMPGERPSKLVWSEGAARLGLSRQQPGVQEIVLPDRRVRLAPGHDVAQIKVDVQEGKTLKLAVLVGQVVQLPPEGQQSRPAPVATEP